MIKIVGITEDDKQALTEIETAYPELHKIADVTYNLIMNDGILSLQKSEDKKSICIDFESGKTLHRLKKGGGKGQDIIKAVGLNIRRDLKILDATAGMGGDSFVFASNGGFVTAIERSPVVYLLLQNALERKYTPEIREIISRINLVNADAKEYIGKVSEHPDVIYLDPMFPDKSKSALPSKEMQILQDLLGKDNDSDCLLAISIEKAAYRVVVKRPRLAPYLAEKEPSYMIEGKSGRFDVYVNKKIS